MSKYSKEYWFLSAAIFLLAQQSVYAIEWNSIPRLQLAQTYDDNVRLASSGSEQSEHITQLRPGISLTGETKNSTLNLDYQLENIIYKSDVNNDKIYHQGRISSNSIFANKRFFLDTDFGYSQTNVSADDSISFDNLAITSNRTNRFDYRLSPYFISSVGNAAELRAYYIYSGINYENNESLLDFKNNRVILNLNNNANFYRIIWNVNYSNSETKYDTGSRIEFEDTNLQLKYLVTSKTYLLATVGDEKNNYPFNIQDEPPEGSYWKAGLGWRPSRRTLVEVQGGERFFGSTKEVLVTHQTRLSNWVMRYNERLQTQNSDDFAVQSGLNQVVNQPVEGGALTNLSNVFTTEVYLSQKFDFGVSWNSRKTSMAISGYQEKRTYQIQKNTDRTRGADLVWGWNYFTNNYINIRETWVKQYFRSSERVDEISDTTLELERRIKPELVGKLAFRTTNRKSNFSANDYQRNLISLIVDMTF